MDDFKIKVDEYLDDFITSHKFGQLKLEKKYEVYSETDISWQCKVFLHGYFTFILQFYMNKSEIENLKVNKVGLTLSQIELLASIVK